MELKPWNIEDQIKTKEELVEYLKAGLEQNDFGFIAISCRDFLEIRKKKGWINLLSPTNLKMQLSVPAPCPDALLIGKAFGIVHIKRVNTIHSAIPSRAVPHR